MDLRDLLEEGCQALSALPAGRLEAEILLAHALTTPRSFLYANPELELPDLRAGVFRKLVQRRAQGEPLAYLTGTREFWSLSLRVTPDVLIPRHETELLVEAGLEHIPVHRPVRVADLGTGSGAIALALASERGEAEVHASDISQAALGVARSNAELLGLPGVRFHEGSWCEPLSGRFEVLLSNPPYVAAGDPHLLSGDLPHEPVQALSSGPDGLDSIREIVRQAPDYLAPGGWLMLEHGRDQGAAVRALLAEHGYTAVETRWDLSGQERVTLGRF